MKRETKLKLVNMLLKAMESKEAMQFISFISLGLTVGFILLLIELVESFK